MPSTPPEDASSSVRITQGHPTNFEPDLNKGGQDGSPKPDGRSVSQAAAMTKDGSEREKNDPSRID